MAMMHRFSNGFDSAIFYFNKSLNYYKEIESSEEIGTTNYSLGKTYQRSGDRDKALPYYLEANRLIVKNQRIIIQTPFLLSLERKMFICFRSFTNNK